MGAPECPPALRAGRRRLPGPSRRMGVAGSGSAGRCRQDSPDRPALTRSSPLRRDGATMIRAGPICFGCRTGFRRHLGRWRRQPSGRGSMATASDLIANIQGFFTPDVVGRLSTLVAETPDATQKAMRSAVPAMLGGVLSLGSRPGGIRQVQALLGADD